MIFRWKNEEYHVERDATQHSQTPRPERDTRKVRHTHKHQNIPADVGSDTFQYHAICANTKGWFIHAGKPSRTSATCVLVHYCGLLYMKILNALARERLLIRCEILSKPSTVKHNTNESYCTFNHLRLCMRSFLNYTGTGQVRCLWYIFHNTKTCKNHSQCSSWEAARLWYMRNDPTKHGISPLDSTFRTLMCY